MTTVNQPTALMALSKTEGRGTVSAARPKPVYSSRTAEKFVLRGYQELFHELSDLGKRQGRSMNSEAVEAVLDAMGQHKRSSLVVKMISGHLGEEVAQSVLARVEALDPAAFKIPDKFNIRLPQNVREVIKEGLDSRSMNSWFLDAMYAWVRTQRQINALMDAALELNR